MKTFSKIILLVAFEILVMMNACKKDSSEIVCNYNIYIPDQEFKSEILKARVMLQDHDALIDVNKDGEICDGEAAELEELVINNSNIKSFEGIEHFPNLKEFVCSGCQLESVSFSCKSLVKFDCSANLLTSLDISDMTKLEELNCSDNDLTEIDVSRNLNLRHLICENNKLSSIDISNNPDLWTVHIGKNAIDSINVGHLTHLFSLDFNETQITSIDLSNNSGLWSISFQGSPIPEIDLSNNLYLYQVEFGDNPMTVLDISVNDQIRYLNNFGKFPFEKICVWTLPFPPPAPDIFSCIHLKNFPASFDGFEICE